MIKTHARYKVNGGVIRLKTDIIKSEEYGFIASLILQINDGEYNVLIEICEEELIKVIEKIDKQAEEFIEMGFIRVD